MGKGDTCIAPGHVEPFSKWDEFVSVSIEPLMLGIQALRSDIPESNFPSNMTALIGQKFGGNTAALARVVGATRRTVLD